MFDVRALLIGKNIKLSDSAYIERTEVTPSFLDEFLREWIAKLKRPTSKKSMQFLALVNQAAIQLESINNNELKNQLFITAKKIKRYGFTDELIAEAFSIIREGSTRSIGLRHHDVQILASKALLQGKIAEMATGEGKTLAATLAICTAASAGLAVHVITVNDYLAERDAEQNIPLFSFFGLEVGVIKQGLPISKRQVEYSKPITYVSNKEITFDYLKDILSRSLNLYTHQAIQKLVHQFSNNQNLLPGLFFAVIDEADSVLIDEARTPLIISETIPDEIGKEIYVQALNQAQRLTPDQDFKLGTGRDAWLTEDGEQKIVELAQLNKMWQSPLWRKELIQKALLATYRFHRDQDYILVDGKIQIVDEFTGRVMPDRTWERGLHQMIEAKEGCDISGQRKTLAQITYQRFFSRYLLVAGMTGTGHEVRGELNRVYSLPIVKIPTHRPNRRERYPDLVFSNTTDRWVKVANRAKEITQKNRCVLIGTRSVEASEHLSQIFKVKNIQHTVLNARQDSDEAMAISRAGQVRQITIATNMAGRGTDIKLSDEVKKNGGLHVILTEYHESPRIDRQLFGRAARQGDPGSVEAIVALTDELFKTYAPTLSSLTSLFIGKNNTSSFLFKILVIYCQIRAESQSRRVRLDTLRRDRKWRQALGFIHPKNK